MIRIVHCYYLYVYLFYLKTFMLQHACTIPEKRVSDFYKIDIIYIFKDILFVWNPEDKCGGPDRG